MFNKYFKKLTITMYKTFVYLIMVGIFVFMMSRVNPSLLLLTRTSVIVISTFLFVLFMLIPIYGNFEIGHRKSKLVFNSTMITLFIANFVAFIVLVIMGINQYPAGLLFSRGLVLLVTSFIIQLIVAWILAHLGNSLYFQIYEPLNTIIIKKDRNKLNQVVRYIESHDKQFNITKIYINPKFEDLDLTNVKQLVLLGMDHEFERKIIQHSYFYDLDLLYNADIENLFSRGNNTIVIDDILMIDYPHQKLTIFQSIVKRTMDILGSIVLLLVTSPIFIFVTIAIKLDDGGSVFYRQERLTKDKKKFEIVKFRSMKINSGSQPVRDNDDRITKVGHVLRKFRIDELPQFINILKGDMSMVGPRPESVPIMNDIVDDLPEFEYRLKVKGGLTGYAQIFGKYNTTPRNKLLLDLKYIESFSIVNDIKLLFQTFIVFVKTDSTEPYSDED